MTRPGLGEHVAAAGRVGERPEEGVRAAEVEDDCVVVAIADGQRDVPLTGVSDDAADLVAVVPELGGGRGVRRSSGLGKQP